MGVITIDVNARWRRVQAVSAHCWRGFVLRSLYSPYSYVISSLPSDHSASRNGCGETRGMSQNRIMLRIFKLV